MNIVKHLFVILFLITAYDKSPAIDYTVVDEKDSLPSADSLLDPLPDPLPDPNINENPIDSLKSDNYFLYIGTYTDGSSKGIYRTEFNIQTGEISSPKLEATLTNPSYLCISPNKKLLWSVSEDWNGPGKVLSYSVNPKNGKLTKVASFSSEGNGPCYVSFHEQSGNVLVANYNSGSVANIPIDELGKAAGDIFSDQQTGKGSDKNRQDGPHAHCILSEANGKHLYSANLGTDKIYVYTIENNKLKRTAEVDTEPGAGPRHLAFHPSGKAMAVINELNSTIALFGLDNDGLFSQPLFVVTTIPDSFKANNQCADIHYSPDGKFLYASNRGHNSIVIYTVDEQNMKIEPLEWISETIDWPRSFLISPDGRYLIVANQNSNNVSIFSRDIFTGKIQFTGTELAISKPVSVLLTNLNE
ncbi:MAG TPA: lactonase family protein [Prolixibacteraceae bacterium]|nr:lactonase family protein [Prolixibacteraceae bacterium]